MKTLNIKNKQNFDMLPIDTNFPFEEMENEICIGDTEHDRNYEQIYLDGPNDSKLLITFQYSDLENTFLDDDIFYSEQIEVKEEGESENEVIEHNATQDTISNFTSVTSNILDVPNEGAIGKSQNDFDSYEDTPVLENISADYNSKVEISEVNYHQKTIKDEPCIETSSTNIPIVEETGRGGKSKSLFGNSLGVSKCNICNKYTKRSCYEAHMKEHYESDSKKVIERRFNDNTSADSSIDKKAEVSSNEYDNGFINDLSYSHEEVVDQKFLCNQCEFFTFSKSNLEYHKKLHDCQKLNKCPYCDYASAQIITMKAHIKSHESSNSYECSKCTYRTTERAHFTRHMRRHTGDKPFKCNLCGYSAVQGSALKSHIRRHYGDKPHKCPFCDYRSVERTSLVRHVRIHTGEKPHSCPYCDYKSIQKSSLKAHLKKHNGKHHECDKCEFKTIQKTCLSRHLKRHSPEKPHKCKLCDYQSIQKASLRTHMRRHMGEKPYQCTHCDYSCVEKTHLNRHQRQHTGEKPIFCFVCDYRCIQFSSLISHYKRHDGVLIPCSFCHFKTMRAELILNHLKAEHKGMWSLQNVNCLLCEFKCNSKNALDAHMRNHIESFAQDAANAVSDKVYKCSECDFKSISKKHLKNHKKIHKQKKY